MAPLDQIPSLLQQLQFLERPRLSRFTQDDFRCNVLSWTDQKEVGRLKNRHLDFVSEKCGLNLEKQGGGKIKLPSIAAP